MKRYIVVMLISIMEIYGMALLGYYHSISGSNVLLILLIVGGAICLLSSIVFVNMLRPRNAKKVDNASKCPYFIDKYDDYYNPEYIDRNL